MTGEPFVQHDQPCWTCKRACGGCRWSRELRPIPGWVANRSDIKSGYKDTMLESYQIVWCPQYVDDGGGIQ